MHKSIPEKIFWGERERARTLVECYVRTCIYYASAAPGHVRPPDCACAKSGCRKVLNVYVIYTSSFNFHEGDHVIPTQ